MQIVKLCHHVFKRRVFVELRRRDRRSPQNTAQARSNSPPADGGGAGSDLRWCKHHQSINLYSVIGWRNSRYSPEGYDIELLGRAPRVGDTSGETIKCCCVEAACGWNGGGMLEEAAGVPVLGTSMSRNNWSREALSEIATAEVGEDTDRTGVGWEAGCEHGSTAAVGGVEDGTWVEQCRDISRSVYSSRSHKAHWIGTRNVRGSISDFWKASKCQSRHIT